MTAWNEGGRSGLPPANPALRVAQTREWSLRAQRALIQAPASFDRGREAVSAIALNRSGILLGLLRRPNLRHRSTA